jgi:hypothetical protein
VLAVAAPAAALVSYPCGPASSFGALPDDGVDDRDALQRATNACTGQTLELDKSGVYQVSTVAQLRGGVSLTLTSSLHGAVGASIKFVGDVGGFDWVGLEVSTTASDVVVSDLALDGSGVTGANEHSPLIRVDGPASIEITRVTFRYPADGKRGDGVSFVGYTPDKTVRAHLHHSVFETCARACVLFHSGTIGEIDHNEFLDGGRAAEIDGEGSGGSRLNIHHNHIVLGPHALSSAGIEIMADDGHEIHDNVLDGKAMLVYGCSLRVARQSRAAGSGDQRSCTLTKESPGFVSRDDVFERSASAGPGLVVQVAQRISSPSAVVLDGDKLVQHTNFVLIQSLGIVGLAVSRVSLVYDGSTPVIAWDAEGISQRTTGLSLMHSILTGTYSTVLLASGSRSGVGDVTITDTTALGAAHGLVCSTPVGVTGPVTLTGNTIGLSTCGGLTP